MSDSLLTREVWAHWAEKIPKAEQIHQLEPGEPEPRRNRVGVIMQFVWTNSLLPSGRDDGKVKAVIFDPANGQIVVRGLNEFVTFTDGAKQHEPKSGA